MELKPLVDNFIFEKKTDNQTKKYSYKNHEIITLVTGVGIAFTSYHLTRILCKESFDYALNIGIAGSFNSEIKIGETVLVTEDEFADLGIESPNDFQTIFEKNFQNPNEFPFKNGKIKNASTEKLEVKNIKKATAITVNTSHGKQSSIDKIKEKFNADIESMEGAAFSYICEMENVKYFQIRTISNFVEERNISNWNIPLALKNLTNDTLYLIDNKLDK